MSALQHIVDIREATVGEQRMLVVDEPYIAAVHFPAQHSRPEQWRIVVGSH